MPIIRTIEQAHAAVADMVWWLKGFAAARPAAIDEGAGDHLRLEQQLGEVRQWLGRVERGGVRRIGDEQAVVISYAELETLFDGIRAAEQCQQFAEVDVFQQITFARNALTKIFSAYQSEAREARAGDEVPF